ncbi:MAG TPA: type II toxin-antitoxin system VapC family toxin [Terracidiphilus sp.]|nr:type II toxin-antitoxin system VapC family toxin [Terracidiphilus sp.]
MSFVLDASIALAWAFPDESSSLADRAAQLLESGRDGAIAPDVWWYEIRNILLVGERRGRISESDTILFLRQMAELRIELDSTRDDTLMLSLGRKHRLTFYDAAYLALAVREHLALATLDKNLAAAAIAENVPILA